MNESKTDVEKHGQGTGSGLTWSMGSSVVASLCCAGPAVAVLLGLGGASFLLGLSRYRIPLLLLGLALAGVGIARALHQSHQRCSPEQHRRNQWMIPTIALATFVITYGLLTYALPTAVYNSLTPASARKTNQQGQSGALSPTPNPTSPNAEEAAPPPEPAAAASQSPASPQPAAAGPRRVTLAISGMT